MTLPSRGLDRTRISEYNALHNIAATVFYFIWSLFCGSGHNFDIAAGALHPGPEAVRGPYRKAIFFTALLLWVGPFTH